MKAPPTIQRKQTETFLRRSLRLNPPEPESTPVEDREQNIPTVEAIESELLSNIDPEVIKQIQLFLDQNQEQDSQVKEPQNSDNSFELENK